MCRLILTQGSGFSGVNPPKQSSTTNHHHRPKPKSKWLLKEPKRNHCHPNARDKWLLPGARAQKQKLKKQLLRATKKKKRTKRANAKAREKWQLRRKPRKKKQAKRKPRGKKARKRVEAAPRGDNEDEQWKTAKKRNYWCDFGSDTGSETWTGARLSHSGSHRLQDFANWKPWLPKGNSGSSPTFNQAPEKRVLGFEAWHLVLVGSGLKFEHGLL